MPINNPTDISGLVSWWTAKSGIVRTGDVIDSWTSQEGSSLVLNSPSSDAKPTMSTDVGVNGREVVVYDGVDDVLENLIADTPSFVIATQTPVIIFLFMKYPSSNTGLQPKIINLQSSVAQRIEMSAVKDGILGGVRCTFAPGSAADADVTDDFSQGDWINLCMVAATGLNSGVIDIRVNNTIIDTGAIGAGIGAEQVVLGSSGGGAHFCNTRYAEILIYGGSGVTLTAQNFTDIQAYFENQWLTGAKSSGIGFGVGSGITGEG